MTLLEWIIDIPAIRDEAKALWGTNREHLTTITVNGKGTYSKPLYLHHLEQMLKSNDPLAYYEQHKPKGKL